MPSRSYRLFDADVSGGWQCGGSCFKGFEGRVCVFIGGYVGIRIQKVGWVAPKKIPKKIASVWLRKM